MDQPDPNADLLQRVKQGDQQALAELFSLHRDRLWRIINFRLDSRLLGRVDADDILQEAYLAASQRIGHYLDGRYLLSYGRWSHSRGVWDPDPHMPQDP